MTTITWTPPRLPTKAVLAAHGLPDFHSIKRVLVDKAKHPETHYQGVFGVKRDCGTAFCIAGQWAVNTGYKTKVGTYPVNSYDPESGNLIEGVGIEIRFYENQRALDANVEIADLWEDAANALRLPYTASQTLFSGLLTLPEILHNFEVLVRLAKLAIKNDAGNWRAVYWFEDRVDALRRDSIYDRATTAQFTFEGSVDGS